MRSRAGSPLARSRREGTPMPPLQVGPHRKVSSQLEYSLPANVAYRCGRAWPLALEVRALLCQSAGFRTVEATMSTALRTQLVLSCLAMSAMSACVGGDSGNPTAPADGSSGTLAAPAAATVSLCHHTGNGEYQLINVDVNA